MGDWGVGGMGLVGLGCYWLVWFDSVSWLAGWLAGYFVGYLVGRPLGWLKQWKILFLAAPYI